MGDQPSNKLDRIADQARKDVGSPDWDDLAREEERRYSGASRRSTEEDPAMPANKAQAQAYALADLGDYYEQRKKYIPKLFRFMIAWVAGLLVLILLSGFEPPFAVRSDNRMLVRAWWQHLINWVFSFRLNDALLIAMVGGTIATLLECSSSWRGSFTQRTSRLTPIASDSKNAGDVLRTNCPDY